MSINRYLIKNFFLIGHGTEDFLEAIDLVTDNARPSNIVRRTQLHSNKYDIISVEKSVGIVLVKLNYNDIRMFSIESVKKTKVSIKDEETYQNMKNLSITAINVDINSVKNSKKKHYYLNIRCSIVGTY